jgi:hypothetical protein
MRRIWVAAAMVVLAGCSGANPEKLATLQSGKTTLAEAMDVLGSPDRDETFPDGSRMLTYVDQTDRPRLVNFIPLPGPAQVWGGWDVKTGVAGLMFGPDGRLRFHTWSSNGAAQRMYVAGQAKSPYAAAPVKATETPAETQDPPSVSGQGAEESSKPSPAN